MAAKCSAIARSGSRCSSPVLPGSAFCFVHAPEAAEARRAAARKGGRNRSAKARAAAQIPDAMSAADLAGFLSLLFTKTMVGGIEPKVASACAAVARTLLDAQTAAAQPSIEDLQEQLATLRALIERGDRGRAA
jgi:hypothetical protein